MTDVNQTKGTGRAWLENSTGLLSHLASTPGRATTPDLLSTRAGVRNLPNVQFNFQMCMLETNVYAASHWTDFQNLR